MTERRMILGTFLGNDFGSHAGAWRMPHVDPGAYTSNRGRSPSSQPRSTVRSSGSWGTVHRFVPQPAAGLDFVRSKLDDLATAPARAAVGDHAPSGRNVIMSIIGGLDSARGAGCQVPLDAHRLACDTAPKAARSARSPLTCACDWWRPVPTARRFAPSRPDRGHGHSATGHEHPWPRAAPSELVSIIHGRHFAAQMRRTGRTPSRRPDDGRCTVMAPFCCGGCQPVVMRTCRAAAGVASVVAAGPGSGWSEVPVCGGRPAALD